MNGRHQVIFNAKEAEPNSYSSQWYEAIGKKNRKNRL